MWVTFGHLRPSGHIMPDHAGDRGAAWMVLAPHDHLHIKQIRAFSRGLQDSGDRGARRWLVVRISGWRLWGRGSGRGRSRGLPPVLCGTHLARSDAGLLGGHRGRVLGGSGWSGARWEPDRAGWPVQQESTATGADLTGRARTCWDGDLHRRTAVDVLPADGMQEVRGSNPRSSTPGQIDKFEILSPPFTSLVQQQNTAAQRHDVPVCRL
jgi:hypothetical protein